LHRSLKRKLSVGLAAVAVAAFAGGAYAATNNSGSNAFLNDVARRLHVTPQQLTAALDGATADQLQAAVKAGRLTQAEANALAQRFKAAGAPALPFGFFGLRAPREPRFLFPGAPLGIGPLGGPGALNAAAGYLGLTTLDLFRQLAGGKSLAQLAAAKGKSVSGLEQAMTVAVKARLDKLVAAKLITAARENQIVSAWSARIKQDVNHEGLGFGVIGIPPRLRFRFGVPGFPEPGNLGVPRAFPNPPGDLGVPRAFPKTPGNAPGPPADVPAPYWPAPSA
jgi:hypothetical protein